MGHDVIFILFCCAVRLKANVFEVQKLFIEQ